MHEKIFSCLTPIDLSTLCINLLNIINFYKTSYVTVKLRFYMRESRIFYYISCKKGKSCLPPCPPLHVSLISSLSKFIWLHHPASSFLTALVLTWCLGKTINSLSATPYQILSYKQRRNEHDSCHKVSSEVHWGRERRSWHGAQ